MLLRAGCIVGAYSPLAATHRCEQGPGRRHAGELYFLYTYKACKGGIRVACMCDTSLLFPLPLSDQRPDWGPRTSQGASPAP